MIKEIEHGLPEVKINPRKDKKVDSVPGRSKNKFWTCTFCTFKNYDMKAKVCENFGC